MNRNKLIEAFCSNLANSIVHQILEKAIEGSDFAMGYNKEVRNSWEISKHYREKINPIDRALPEIDIEEIRKKVSIRVNAELRIRIERGYENIDLSLVDELIEKALKEMIIE